MAWKVGNVQMVQVENRAATTFGFYIQNEHGAPLFAFGYATEEEAEAAKAAIEPCVQSAVFLSDSGGYNQFSTA